MVEVPGLEEVGASAGDDEEPEPEKDPAKGNVLPLADEEDEGERDRGVGQGDEQVRDEVQPDQPRLPQIAVPVRHEAVGREELRHGRSSPPRPGLSPGAWAREGRGPQESAPRARLRSTTRARGWRDRSTPGPGRAKVPGYNHGPSVGVGRTPRRGSTGQSLSFHLRSRLTADLKTFSISDPSPTHRPACPGTGLSVSEDRRSPRHDTRIWHSGDEMMPDGNAFVLTSSNERGGVPSAKKRFPRAQQDRIDGQHDFIRKPMFEQRRCQRGATREDKVRAVLRLDAANALDDGRSKALERTPFKTLRTVGSDEFCCRMGVRQRTVGGLAKRSASASLVTEVNGMVTFLSAEEHRRAAPCAGARWIDSSRSSLRA